MVYFTGLFIYLVCEINLGEHPWLTVVFLVVMWIAGYQIRPYIHPYLTKSFQSLRTRLAPVKKRFGPPLRGWLSNPRPNLEVQDHARVDRESKPEP